MESRRFLFLNFPLTAHIFNKTVIRFKLTFFLNFKNLFLKFFSITVFKLLRFGLNSFNLTDQTNRLITKIKTKLINIIVLIRVGCDFHHKKNKNKKPHRLLSYTSQTSGGPPDPSSRISAIEDM